MENRAAAGMGLEPQPAMMRLDDRTADLQADAETFLLRGVKGLEELGGGFRADAATAIGDGNQRLAVGARRAHGV